MSEIDYSAVLIERTQAFADLVHDRDMSMEIPTCPGWSLTDLVEHLGHGHRWSAQIVAQGLQAPPDWLNVPDVSPADYSSATLSKWLPEAAQTLADAFEHRKPEATVWTMLGPRPAEWWVKRRVQETLIHSVDASMALGEPYDFRPDLAAAGIGELLDLIVPRAGEEVLAYDGLMTHPVPLMPGEALRLRAVDPEFDEATWTVVRAGDGLEFSEDHERDATVLEGPAADVLLTMTRRRGLAGSPVKVTGDPAVLDRWLDGTPYR